MSDLKSLKIKRKAIIAKLDRMLKVAEAAIDDSERIREFVVRYNDLQQCSSQFEDIQLSIDVLCSADDTCDLEVEEAVRESFEDKMYSIKTHFQTVTLQNGPEVTGEPAALRAPNVKLPQLSISTFSGNLSEWCGFSDLFKSLIHNNPKLSHIEKFQYLKGALRDEPLGLIRNLPVNGVNYAVAWNLLESKYDNKRLIVSHHIEQILGLNSVTSPTFQKLRAFCSVIQENMSALRALQVPVDSWSDLLVVMVSRKLDRSTRTRWEHTVQGNELPKFDDLLAFLQKQVLVLETLVDTSVNNDTKSFPKPHRTTTLVTSNTVNCPSCKEVHFLYQCPTFRKDTVDGRFQFAKEHQLCLNCLRPNHRLASCTSSSRCQSCQGKHHSLLHFNSSTRKTGNSSQPVSPTKVEAKSVSLVTDSVNNTVVLLPTAIIEVLDATGTPHVVRALLDSASQANYVSEACFRKLGLPRKPYKGKIHALGDEPLVSAKGSTTCTIRPRDTSEPSYKIEVLVFKTITGNMPASQLPAQKWPHLTNLKLADPHFNESLPIDMLIGASLFPALMQAGKVQAHAGAPTALNTVFGWVLMGESQNQNVSTFHTFHLTNATDSLDSQVKRFWELEDFSEKGVASPEDVKCEAIFAKTHKRTKTGRYCVSLPFRSLNPVLGNSYNIAYHCLDSLNRRLDSDPQLRAEYSSFLQDYLDNGHMEQILKPDLNIGYFIPHHCVLKPESITTKLRVVSNASRKTDIGTSLNDLLYPGPPLQQGLVSILLKFRFWKIVMTADIKQMYRQILVNPDHRPFQRILWNFNPQEPPHVYQLNTVTYGMNCAPFLALRALKQLASDERGNFPNAARILESDIYVDDVITGANLVEDALALQAELVELVGLGGFELRKWSSNNQAILQDLPPGCTALEPQFELDRDSVLKVLGLQWSPGSDHFSYGLKPFADRCTKRLILSDIARIFDPLGWLTPVTLFAKITLQTLWSLSLGWDEEPPDEVVRHWTIFRDQLSVLSSISIPRLIPIHGCRVDLLGFCDASEAGYAAVVYLRISSDSVVHISLVSAKSRVAPLKRISLPRLELCSALLLARLWRTLVGDFHFEIDHHWAWSDSTVALTWIRSPPHRWKTFVSNRTSEIQDSISSDKWNHIRSIDNPADCASRGIFPVELPHHPLWWTGPPWIKDDPTTWPLLVSEPNDSADVERSHKMNSTVVLVASNEEFFDLLDNYSSLLKLQRVTAYLFRFANNCRSERRMSEYLTTSELERALIALIKVAQSQHFSQDLKLLRSNQSCSRNLRMLNPFLDEVGVLRVGGRLRHSSLAEGQKHPILLPSGNSLTKLIIRHYHYLYLHPGPQTLHAILFQRYWIISGRKIIRNELLKCKNCFRCTPQPWSPFMGDLPSHRVTQLKPFQVVGVDYAGPFSVTLSRHRGVKSQKAYLCLFVCFATKALHLELASDLSTEAFLAALRRFLGRRGRCSDIYSDCGTNFVGAKRQLSELHSLLEAPSHNESISTALVSEGIQWHLNPPSAPHFGGLFEAGVKSVKTHLLRCIGEQILTYEELNTIFVQIEALLNSRPLCPLGSDPSDFSVLTPGHFLVGEPLIGLSEPSLSHIPINRLTRWQLIQRVRQDFWKRWNLEYLHTLQQRHKWNVRTDNPIKGTMVLIKDNQAPPMRWLMGRILDVFPGPDGVVRVAKVKTVNGVLTRPLVKLCPLPHD